MRQYELPTEPVALNALLEAVMDYRDRLKFRHIKYMERVPRFRQLVKYHEERDEHEAILAAHMEMVPWDEAMQAHRAADPDFANISAYVDWEFSWEDESPDPTRPWWFSPGARAAFMEWQAKTQKDAIEGGSSPDEPLLEVMRGLERDIRATLNRPPVKTNGEGRPLGTAESRDEAPYPAESDRIHTRDVEAWSAGKNYRIASSTLSRWRQKGKVKHWPALPPERGTIYSRKDLSAAIQEELDKKS